MSFSEAQIAAWLKEREQARFFVRAYPTVVKVMDDPQRVLRFAISDERRDRDGDIVRQLGLDTSEYAQNPVVFMGRGPMHANSGFPIARSLKVFRKYAANGMLTSYSDDMFAGDAQGHDEAELAYALARDGFLNTTSIGFRPIAVRDLPDEALTSEEKTARDAGQWVRGYDIRRSLKYEHTLVGIPSNIGATAVRSLKELGLEPGPRTVADFVDVARKYLKGGRLDSFRQALIGERELITIGAFTVEKAPEAYRESLARDIAETDVADPGFDAWEQWTGKACPEAEDAAPVVKDAAAEPEPEAAATTKDAPMEIQTLIFAKSKFPKKSDATKWAADHKFKADQVDETGESWRLRQFDPALCEAGGERTITITDGIKAGTCKKTEEQGEPADEAPTAGDEKAAKDAEPPIVPPTIDPSTIHSPADVLRFLIAADLKDGSADAVARAMARAKQLEALLAPPPAPPTPASIDVAALAERFEKALVSSEARTARLIEAALVDLDIRKDDELFRASAEPTRDPVRVAKDASPPAMTTAVAVPAVDVTAVATPAVPAVQIDSKTIASIVPALVQAIDFDALLERAISRHRGGVTMSDLAAGE